ncbi:MAG: radical SAM protein, partial [Alphaproteobacteria bacterium]|nr:radical SAM protein [Alphaproteobacteria bacterium]
SSPSIKKNKSLSEIEKMLDALVASEGEPDVVQISGGEPTIHPEILEILALAKTKPIRHLMLNTNGVRIARERDFVEKLSKFMPGFEKEALENLRGTDLRTIRRKAIEHLNEFNISTTLVVTVKKGVNDHEIGKIIDYALEFKNIRGITLQPVQDAGRNLNFNKNTDRILLSDIRQAIIAQSSHFKAEDIIPLPCNPESISIAYAIREGKKISPVTSLIPKADLVAEVPNAIAFEKNKELRQKVIDLFSLSSGAFNTAQRMQALLCCLPEVPVLKDLSYENIFRITIIQFLDKYNFCVGNVKRSCIHFVTPEGQIIPFDTYNLLYRNGQVNTLRLKHKQGGSLR